MAREWRYLDIATLPRIPGMLLISRPFRIRPENSNAKYIVLDQAKYHNYVLDRHSMLLSQRLLNFSSIYTVLQAKSIVGLGNSQEVMF